MRSLTKARSDLGQRGAAAAEDRGTRREKAEERRRRRRRGREGVAIGRRIGKGIDRKGGDELGQFLRCSLLLVCCRPSFDWAV